MKTKKTSRNVPKKSRILSKNRNLRKIKLEKIKKEVEKKAEKIEAKELSRIQRGAKKKIIILAGVLLGLVANSLLLFLDKTIAFSFASFFVVAGLFFLYSHFQKTLREASDIKKIEASFPDFLQLMASNLRAGMTIDRAMLLSARPEFAPLDREILNVGKDIATGKSIETALLDMSKRIKSEKLEKTILLIISGIRAGGNLAVLLEETSVNFRERSFVEKKAASSVLMYVIFIFMAASVGSPALFSLSSILVETLINLLAEIPIIETSTIAVPFTLSSINLSANFIKYFSLIFIIVTDILASLILGLASKGEEKEGLKYLVPMSIISITIFFIIRFLLSGVVAGFFQ